MRRRMKRRRLDIGVRSLIPVLRDQGRPFVTAEIRDLLRVQNAPPACPKFVTCRVSEDRQAQRGRDGFSSAAAISFSGDHAHRGEQEMMVDGDNGGRHCKNIDASLCYGGRLRRFVCFPRARDRALDLLPFQCRDLTRHPALDDGRVVSKERTMASGTVKWFNAQKGYGFIQPEDGSKDVFVHISAVERAGLSQLNENQKVTYELERGQQGKTSAVNLQVT